MENQKNVLDLSMYTTEALIADFPANRMLLRDANGEWSILRKERENGGIVTDATTLKQKNNESFRDFLCRHLQIAYEDGYNGAFFSARKTHITLNIERLVDKMEIHTAEDAIKSSRASTISDEMVKTLNNALNNALNNVKNHQA